MPNLSPEAEKIGIETWKTAVGVQQHFNTIEMQIRSLAITALTATITAAGVIRGQLQQAIAEALKAGQAIPPTNIVKFMSVRFSASDMVLLAGLLAWFAFYFMDRWWYHRLLKGSVAQATAIEKAFAEAGYGQVMGLSATISEASPFTLFGEKIDSTKKVDLFYTIIAFVPLVMIVWVF